MRMSRNKFSICALGIKIRVPTHNKQSPALINLYDHSITNYLNGVFCIGLPPPTSYILKSTTTFLCN